MPKQHKCPQCKKVVLWENNPYRPFCSKRCKIIDLGHWASEKYKIPGEKIKNVEALRKKEEEKK